MSKKTIRSKEAFADSLADMFNGQVGMLGVGMLPSTRLMDQAMNRAVNEETQQAQQQVSKNEDDARFMPPKTLRDLLDELIREQQECLALASNRLAALRNVAQQGRDTPGKGPGDEYISTERLASVKQSVGRASSDEQPRTRRYSRMLWSSTPRFTWPLDEIQDPLGRYQELEVEILELVRISTSQEWQRNPMQALHARWTAKSARETNPKRVADDRLAKLLGPAGGSAKIPDVLPIGAPADCAGNRSDKTAQ